MFLSLLKIHRQNFKKFLDKTRKHFEKLHICNGLNAPSKLNEPIVESSKRFDTANLIDFIFNIQCYFLPDSEIRSTNCATVSPCRIKGSPVKRFELFMFSR